MTWLPSCSSADNDYGIYEGTIGSWTSHAPVTCTTGGATNHTFTPGAGSRYYLLSPNNGNTDGSYGVDSNGDERLPGAAECHTQALGDCP